MICDCSLEFCYYKPQALKKINSQVNEKTIFVLIFMLARLKLTLLFIVN